MQKLKEFYKKRKSTAIWLVVIIACGCVLGINYLRDVRRYYKLPPHFKGNMSHFGEVSLTVHVGTLGFYLGYINACNKIPENYEEVFKPIESDHLQCKPRRVWHLKWPDSLRKDYRPWIDPWGRPYQIRYDRNRKKIQIRSQGRYGWTSLDDIETETYFDGNDYGDQVKKCDELPEDSSECIFNWGWH